MSKVLNILLQRNDTHHPWGFSIAGTPGALYIDKVSPGALSAQHLVVGDRLLQIAGIESKQIDVWEAKEILNQPQRSLELIVLKSNQSSRRFSDGSESSPSSTGSVPWRRVRPASTISLDGRKSKNQFWERCSGLHSRDFYNSVDSDLFRMRDIHSRSHSVERDSSITPDSYLSNTDLYNYSVASEPLWAYKTGRRNISSKWDRTQSFTDESTTLFPGTRIKKPNKTDEKPHITEKESSCSSSFSRQTSCPESESTKMFKEFSSNKPGKFPWFDGFDEFCSSSSSKKLDEEISSSFSERSFLKSYNKKEMKSYQFEESSKKMSDHNKSSFNEHEKEYFYRRRGTFMEENSPSFDEVNRSYTPAGFYENHEEEYLKSEHSILEERGKSVEREEISHCSYSRESTPVRNFESTPTETKEEFSSSSRFTEPKSSVEKPNYYNNSVPKSDRNFSKTQTYCADNKTHTNNNSSEKGSEFNTKNYQLKTKTTESSPKSNETLKSSDIGLLEKRESNTECFSKCISDKENRSIFDARKYWSCTSPTSEAQFVFIPMQKPIPSIPAQKSSKLQQVNEDQELSNEATKTISVENEKSNKDTLQDVQGENNQQSYQNNMSSEPVPWRRQQNQISGGNSYTPAPPVSAPIFDSVPASSPAAAAPLAPPPPPPPPSSGGVPPPPPPIGLVHIPAIRLKSEIPDVRREPPAAIQNAMMKDKKPFTYTPGGLDLSEIRSPRMQRRISRNAQTTDSTQGAPVQQTQQPSRPVSLTPSAAAAMQPQIAIPVFPPTSPNINHSAPPPPPAPPVNNIQSSPPPPPQPMAVPKTQPQRHPLPQQHNQNSGSIYVPPVQQSSQPRAQLGSLYIPPVQQPPSQQEYLSAVPTPPVPSAHLNKAPTPWLSRQSQPQKEVPPWVNREDSTPSPVTNPNFQSNQKQPQVHHQPQPQLQQQARIIPIQMEGHEHAQPNTRIIPITIEGTPPPKQNNNPPNFQQQQHYNQQPQQKFQQHQQQQQRWPVYVHNKFNPPSPSLTNENSNITNGRTPQSPQPNWSGSGDGSSSPAPVQSRSFRVLQKITDTDPVEGDQIDAPYNSQGVPVSQLRKLQLSDDDRALMNKVKTQVDEDIFLHTESEPRYRGAAIPSRAFRMLQNMTDPGNVPQGPNDSQLRSPNRRPTQQEAASPAQPYVHPSEQQVQEPRMYTGAAIPSRSFKMLQAMTGPDPSGRPDESDY